MTMPISVHRAIVSLTLIFLSRGFRFHQSAVRNFIPDIFKRQLAQFATSEYLIVGDLRNGKRRLRKTVKLFIRFETDLGQHQSKQVAEKHVDGKLSAGEFERVTILSNFVSFKDRQRLSLSRIEVSVGDYRSRQVFR